MIPPIITLLLETAQKSCEELRNRITNVKYGPIENGADVILFELDGIKYKGKLTGRNKDFILGFGKEQDSAIALRVLLDKDAEIA